MKLTIPELSLVVLIGASGSGKSTFAKKYFKATEVLSSDFCRGLVSDDENDQSATPEAFEVLNFIAAKRLAAGKLTVIDATNVQPESLKGLLELARTYHTLVTALVFDLPEKLCQQRNAQRPDRDFGPHVIHRQLTQMHRSLRSLRSEGFHHIYTLHTLEEVESVEIERQRLWSNLKTEHGPFDIIGDIHGCFPELQTLLQQLGYQLTRREDAFSVTHPQGRKAVFLGDLVDRGPDTPNVLRLVMDMVASGTALCVPGNHDIKLMRKLKGHDVRVNHGLAESLAQIAKEPPAFKERIVKFLDELVSHYVLNDGKLVVAHAGMKETMQGRGSRVVREFALYGETTGETDEFGLPVRYNWAAEYRGKAMVVYGHTPVPAPDWLNNTINIDTGCVFGGKLTALRYPEKELLAVPAAWTYSEPVKPFLIEEEVSALNAQQQSDDILDIEDVMGKRFISTPMNKGITIREENAIAALEVMSRFAANPKWLMYLPPTMSPCGTSKQEGLLEHPAEAFAYYKQEGIKQVVCEEKHMGSRAVVIVCKDEEAARTRFGVVDKGIGICYTRTGRRFFDDAKLEAELLKRVCKALDSIDFWGTTRTDWVCLDCELMPWSVKAQSLVLQQYAAVGAASQAALAESVAALEQAATHNADMQDVLASYTHRQDLSARYVQAYRNYCWPVESISDLKLAPFHIIATQGHTFFDADHEWHMDMIECICKEDTNLLLATPYKVVVLDNEKSIAEAIEWWEKLTARGGEGMVVKPAKFTEQGIHGIVQPAVKCRGPEYLRIIYGPEYDAPENLERLRQRGLGAKRSLAMREFALGVEAVERFVRSEPLRLVHECVFGVLALESEPVDPRL